LRRPRPLALDGALDVLHLAHLAATIEVDRHKIDTQIGG
jgi:hypothetical protein